MYAKFEQNTLYSLISIAFTGLFPYLSIMTLTYDLSNIIYLLIMSNIFIKLDQNKPRVCSLPSSQGFFSPYLSIVTLTFDHGIQ